MANHVNTWVKFERLNDAGKAKLQELYARVRTIDGERPWFSDMWGLDPTVSDTYEWNCDNVGPKWCYFEDREEDCFQTTSAWSYPEQGILWLIEQLAEVDPDVLAYVTYEDEMPNFFGCWFFNKEGIYDGQEWDEEEMREMMKESVFELAELNEEEDSDRYWEIWSDNIWELVGIKQYEVYQSIIMELNDNGK
jgi:hypothetical protein